MEQGDTNQENQNAFVVTRINPTTATSREKRLLTSLAMERVGMNSADTFEVNSRGKNLLKNPNMLYVLVCKGPIPAGYAGYLVHHKAQVIGTVESHIHPEFGRSVSSVLFGAIDDHARELGYHSAELDEAHPLLRSKGYHPLSRANGLVGTSRHIPTPHANSRYEDSI